MCGIVGFTGNHQAAPILLYGLSRLEYRGYDSAGLAVKKGQEKGNFEFGGSTIILLIQPEKVRIDYDLIENTEGGYETIVKMGERIGECRKSKNTKNHYEGIIKNA